MSGIRLGATRRWPGRVWVQFWLVPRWKWGSDTRYRGIVHRRHVGPLTLAWMAETKPGDRKRFRDLASRSAASSSPSQRTP